MTLRTHHITLFILCLLFAFSCSKKWDKYNGTQDPALSGNLLKAINQNPELSQFAEYLRKTGYDQVIASSKSFTIWAPTNAAMQQVDPAILSDTGRLKQFVGNHISNQLYFTSDVQTFLYIKTLNGKNVTFTKTTVDDEPIVKADQYVSNGVIQEISGAIIPKPNAYEYLMSTTLLQQKELASLNYTFFDPATAIQTGVDPNTGRPIYKAGTGTLPKNRFTDLAPINNEDSLYTYVVLTDAAYNAEKAKIGKYFAGPNPVFTDSVTNFNVIRSLAFKGLYTADQFPDTLYSVADSVKFHLEKTAIAETHRVSNGIVYVMNSINYKLLGTRRDRFAKIPTLILQGEKWDSLLTTVPQKTPAIRTRRNPDSTVYQDAYLENSAIASFWINYRTKANAVKYKVYWRVPRDKGLVLSGTATDLTYYPMNVAFQSQTTVAFTQPKPGVIDNGVNPATGLHTYSTDYSEVYLGEYTSPQYYSGNKLDAGGLANFLKVFLVSNNTTANGTNTLLLDYIKLVPVP